MFFSNRNTLCLVLLLVFQNCASMAFAAPASLFEMGIAVKDVTPPVNYRMSGYFHERLSTGTDNPLQAKALVLRQGQETIALVFCDLVGISPDVSQQARKQIEKELGIPAQQVMIAATHSHTGPLYFGALRKQFHDQAVAKHGNDPYEKFDYPQFLVGQIVHAVKAAQQNLQPTTVRHGTGSETRLSFNRRFHMTVGPVRFNPGYQNPNVVRVAGPIDPEIGMLMFHPENDTKWQHPTVGLSVFALHLDTVGGTQYAADYPFHLENKLRQKLGKDFVSLFGAGTCGDINHVDTTSKERRKADQIGSMLGDSILAAEPKLQPVKNLRLESASSIVKVPVQKYDQKQIDQAKIDILRVGDRAVPFLERVETYKIMALQLRDSDSIELETQVFRLSDDIAIVGLPGEIFVDLGLAIKAASPFKTTLVVELCNDAPGYLPTRKAFVEGSYETVNSRIASGGAEVLIKESIRLLKSLKSSHP